MPGVGRNGTGRGRTNAGVNSNATGKDNRYACCYFLTLFLYFHLFFILLFFFSDYLFSDNYNNRRGAKGNSRPDGTGYTWAAMATLDGAEAQRGQTGQMGASSFIVLSFLLSSFILIILLLFRLSFQWSTTRGGQDKTDGNAGRDGGAGRHDRYVFCYSFSSYSSLFFFSLLLSLLSQTTATDEARPSGTGQDGTTRRQQCGTGGRRAGGGGRRREEGGLTGNMGTAEAEGQVTLYVNNHDNISIRPVHSFTPTFSHSR